MNKKSMKKLKRALIGFDVNQYRMRLFAYLGEHYTKKANDLKKKQIETIIKAFKEAGMKDEDMITIIEQSLNNMPL